MNHPAQDQSLDWQAAQIQSTLTSLINVFFRGIEERLVPYGLAVLEYSILHACVTSGPISISSLTQLVPVDAGQVSRVVTKLSDRNLVRKVRTRVDQRVVKVEVTEAGNSLMLELTRAVGEHYTYVVSSVSKRELDQLTAFIGKMLANAESASPPTDVDAGDC